VAGIFHILDSKYFGIGKIAKDQVEDYALIQTQKHENR
jgi:hypothetical protein